MSASSHIDDSGLCEKLRELGIDFENHKHPPLATVEDSKALRGHLPGLHIKNLFLRDKKRRYFLVTVEEDREVDLKTLRHRIGGQGTLSFGNAEALWEYLGVTPGAVTPFAIVNDRAGSVTIALDTAVANASLVNAHPLRNDMTTSLTAADLLRFLETENHPPMLLDFSSPT